jgi:hypothetical protein
MVVLKVTGESYTPLDQVIEDKEKYLIGYAYDESNYRYLKYKELSTRKRQTVLALGSSRVLQFRENMFDSAFYNAGYTISSISDFVPFVEANLKGKYPKVLLIALDQWMFNKNWDNLSGYGIEHKKWNNSPNSRASSSTILNTWTDLLNHKYGAEVLTQHSEIKKIGLNAIVNNTGFRNDGSMYYGGQIAKLIKNDSTSKDYHYSDTYARIRDGNKRFQYGNELNSKALVALNDWLMFCKKNKIYVVAVLPPFADKVNQRMHESGNYKYMDSIYVKSNEIFKTNGFELWDMSDLSKYGSGDEETIDGFHGGEVTHLKMLIYIIENGSALKNFTNVQRLKDDLRQRKNSYTVYSDETM